MTKEADSGEVLLTNRVMGNGESIADSHFRIVINGENHPPLSVASHNDLMRVATAVTVGGERMVMRTLAMSLTHFGGGDIIGFWGPDRAQPRRAYLTPAQARAWAQGVTARFGTGLDVLAAITHDDKDKESGHG